MCNQMSRRPGFDPGPWTRPFNVFRMGIWDYKGGMKLWKNDE